MNTSQKLINIYMAETPELYALYLKNKSLQKIIKSWVSHFVLMSATKEYFVGYFDGLLNYSKALNRYGYKKGDVFDRLAAFCDRILQNEWGQRG